MNNYLVEFTNTLIIVVFERHQLEILKTRYV